MVPLTGIKGGAISVDVGSDIDVRASMVCSDTDTAKKMKKDADESLEEARKASNQEIPPGMPKEMRKEIEEQMETMQDVLDSIDISRSGATITFEVTIGEKLIDMMMGQITRGMF